jgi:hypothetical protein
LRLEVTLAGISNGGNGDNNTPRRPERSATVQVINQSNQPSFQTQTTLRYSADTGSYGATIILPAGLPDGTYTIKARFDNTLLNRSAPVAVRRRTTTTIPRFALISGDIYRNDKIDIFDYNAIVSCYGDRPCDVKQKADLNDDGAVGLIDYNILLAHFDRVSDP